MKRRFQRSKAAPCVCFSPPTRTAAPPRSARTAPVGFGRFRQGRPVRQADTEAEAEGNVTVPLPTRFSAVRLPAGEHHHLDAVGPVAPVGVDWPARRSDRKISRLLRPARLGCIDMPPALKRARCDSDAISGQAAVLCLQSIRPCPNGACRPRPTPAPLPENTSQAAGVLPA